MADVRDHMQKCYPTTTAANDLKLWIFAINGTPAF
jgi:hypothetical protein